jgi:hypothetical protein
MVSGVVALVGGRAKHTVRRAIMRMISQIIDPASCGDQDAASGLANRDEAVLAEGTRKT